MSDESKYPRTIKIGSSTWTLKFVPKRSDRSWFGICRPKRKEIQIERGQAREALFETFLHEAIHAAEAEYGFKVDHDAIHNLEGPLRRLLTDNQALLDLLISMSS